MPVSKNRPAEADGSWAGEGRLGRVLGDPALSCSPVGRLARHLTIEAFAFTALAFLPFLGNALELERLAPAAASSGLCEVGSAAGGRHLGSELGTF